MSTALDAVAAESRAVIEQELEHRDPALLDALRGADEPTTGQREAVEQLLANALMKHFDADYMPSERGLQIERAISAFLEAWPIYRE